MMNGRTKHRSSTRKSLLFWQMWIQITTVFIGGTSYSIFEDLPGVVVSITPCIQNDQYGLLVAITNLYSDDIWFNGSAVALDEDGINW